MDALALYEAQPEAKRGTPEGLLFVDDKAYWERLAIGAELTSAGLGTSHYGLTEAGSVLDVGCGYGDLQSLLSVHVTYVGIEMTPWVYREARLRHPQSTLLRARFEDLDGMGSFDVVALLGILATTEKAEWTFVMARARRMARKAVVVSWLEQDRYAGKLVAGTEETITAAFTRQASEIRDVAGDANRTALFRV